MEQYTRTKINTQLKNLGWILSGADKNVFQEEPRTPKEKEKLGGLRPDYVLYASDSGRYEPLAIIEAKTYKTKGLDGAIQQAETYAGKLNAPIVFATDGIYCQTKHIIDKQPLIYNGEAVNSLIEEEKALGFLTSHTLDTRPPEVKIAQGKLISIFKDINNLLRKNGLFAGYERFSEFATILFLKLFSEREKQAGYRKLAQLYSWEHLKTLASKDLLSYVSKAVFPEIAKLYKDKDLFPEKLRITDNNIFKQVFDKINPLQLSYINQDVKGKAFEYFLANSPSADKDLGEYFTPRHIVKTMVAMLDPKIGEKIYDPFCGTGGMLLESYKHIFSNMEQTKDNIKKLKTDTLYGRELTSKTRVAKMNMILAGDGHTQIKQCDSLAPDNLREIKEKFDVVITNFPFSQQTDHTKAYTIPSSRGDSICLQHCIEALKQGGRMAVVAPEGVLFRKDLKTTRKYLLQHCHINHIISLPQGVFEPYTGVKTNILHCTKKKAAGKVWFYEVKQDGFSLDTKRRKLEGRSDLDKFLSFSNVGDHDKPDFGFTPVDTQQIKEKAYSLRLNDYITETPPSRSKWPMVKLGKVADLIRGITFSKEEYLTRPKENYIGIITTKSAQKDGISYNDLRYIKGSKVHTNKIIQPNDILMSMSNSLNLVGRTTFVDKLKYPLSFGAFILCIRHNVNIIPKYLYFCLNSHEAKQYYLKEARTTTNISNLTPSIIQSMHIPFPSLEKQKSIVQAIEQEEGIIAQNKSLIEMMKKKIQNKINALWEVEGKDS